MKKLFYLLTLNLFSSYSIFTQNQTNFYLKGYYFENDTLELIGKDTIKKAVLLDVNFKYISQEQRKDIRCIFKIKNIIYYVNQDKIIDNNNNTLLTFNKWNSYSYPIKIIVYSNKIYIAFTQNIIEVYDLNFNQIDKFDLKKLDNYIDYEKSDNSTELIYDININDFVVDRFNYIWLASTSGLYKLYPNSKIEKIKDTENDFISSVILKQDTLIASCQNNIFIKPNNYQSILKIELCNLKESIQKLFYINDYNSSVFMICDSGIYKIENILNYTLFKIQKDTNSLAYLYYSNTSKTLYAVKNNSNIVPINLNSNRKIKSCKYPSILEKTNPTHFSNGKTSNFIFRVPIDHEFKVEFDNGNTFEDRIIIREGEIEKRGKIIYDSGFTKGKRISDKSIISSKRYINIEIQNKNVSRKTGWDFWFNVFP